MALDMNIRLRGISRGNQIMVRIAFCGDDTYSIKDELKNAGFLWYSQHKFWVKTVPLETLQTELKISLSKPFNINKKYNDDELALANEILELHRQKKKGSYIEDFLDDVRWNTERSFNYQYFLEHFIVPMYPNEI